MIRQQAPESTAINGHAAGQVFEDACHQIPTHGSRGGSHDSPKIHTQAHEVLS